MRTDGLLGARLHRLSPLASRRVPSASSPSADAEGRTTLSPLLVFVARPFEWGRTSQGARLTSSTGGVGDRLLVPCFFLRFSVGVWPSASSSASCPTSRRVAACTAAAARSCAALTHHRTQTPTHSPARQPHARSTHTEAMERERVVGEVVE